MTLPASHPITAQQINIELGRLPTAVFNMNGAEERALAGVPSGSYSFSNFLGKSAGGGGAVSGVEYLGAAGGGSNLSLFNRPDFPIGAADPSRLIVVAAHWLETTTHRSVTDINVGGVTGGAAQAGHTGGDTGFGAALTSRLVPTGTTALIRVTFSGEVTSLVVQVYRLTGLSQLASDTDENAQLANNLNTVVQVGAGGAAIAAYMGSTGIISNAPTFSGITKKYGTQAITGGFLSGLSADATYDVGTTGVSSSSAGNCLITLGFGPS